MDRREFLAASAMAVTAGAGMAADSFNLDNHIDFPPGKFVGDYRVDEKATEMIRKYTDDHNLFKINQYADFVPLDGTEKCWEVECFGKKVLTGPTTRYCFPFDLTRSSPPEIIAETAAMQAMKVVTVRTMLAATLLGCELCWNGRYRKVSIDDLSIIESLMKDLQNQGISKDNLFIVMNPVRARAIAISEFFQDYVRKNSEIIELIKCNQSLGEKLSDNPNRKYGMPPSLYKIKLVVDNSVVSTNTSRVYAWPSSLAVLGYKSSKSDNKFKSTLEIKYRHRMTVETRDNSGRITDNYVVGMNPESGYAIEFTDQRS